jgi:hypothetical protein
LGLKGNNLPCEEKPRKHRLEKAVKSQRDLRLAQIKKMLVGMHTKPDIVRYASLNWGITKRQTEVYLKWANDEIQASLSPDKKIIAKQIIAAQMDLYLLARENEDYSVAKGLLMDIAKIAGVSVDHIVMEHRELHSLPEEELNAIEEELEDNVTFNH